MSTSSTQYDFHPESKAFMELLEANGLNVTCSAHPDRPIESFRETVKGLFTMDKKVVEYDGKREEMFVPSEEVHGGIPVYVYTPRFVPPDPTVLIYFHGGGNISGNRDMVDETCKILSSLAECVVVNVEYRLAPEHKFPAMCDDAVAVAQWVLANPAVVGGTQKSKVGAAGDSGGGLLTASVAHDVPGLAFQILIYALLSGATHDSPSFREFAEATFLGVRLDFALWMESLVAEKREDLDSPRYHILGHEKYDHLPPTLLFAAEFDQLRDEGYEYARRLEAAVVESEVFFAKGAMHGYFVCPGFFPELCRESHAKAIEFIKKFKSVLA